MAATAVDTTDILKPITLTTFHPEWETIEQKFWAKRVGIILFAITALAAILWVGYTWPESKMPTIFQDPLRVVEFSLWWVTCMFLIELAVVAGHKVTTTKIKYNMSKNEEMRVSITFNRAFAVLFIMVFLFNILKLVIRFILDFPIWNSNIYRYTRGEISLIGWVLNALYIIVGFGGYAEMLYAFEKVVMGRRVPLLWIITPIGVLMMLFLPYDVTVFDLPFATGIVWHMELFYFSQWLAISGGIFVPILYFVMARRFAYGFPQTSKDCSKKGIGFVLATIGAVFDSNFALTFASWGGFLLFFEILTWVFLAPILMIAGGLLIRSAYRPKG